MEVDSVLNPQIVTFTFYRQLCIAICVQELRSATKKIPSLSVLFISSNNHSPTNLIIHLQFALQCGFLTPRRFCSPASPAMYPYQEIQAKPSGLDPQIFLKKRL